MRKLAIVTTHPIQYNAPLFRLLATGNKIVLKVFYTWSQAKDKIYDPDFGINRNWDIPLLDGYSYSFVDNISPTPGSHHREGIINPTLNEEIEEWGADAILLFGWNFVSHLKAMRYFKGKIPVCFRGDSTLLDEPEGFSIKKLIRRISLKWVYRHIDYALVVGTANKEYYKVHGLKDEQLVYAPHAIDNNRFCSDDNQQNKKANDWRDSLRIGPDEVVFLFAGKLSRKKNPEILIRAFKKLKDKSKRKLVIAGTGELEEELKGTYENDSDIRFINFQNQSLMPVLYRMADVYILSSAGPGETWGLSVNEAMACNRPAIVSEKCGCYLDLIDHGLNGFVFHTEAELERYLSNDKSQYQNMGVEAKRKIENFNFEKIVMAIEKLVVTIYEKN